MSPKETLQQKIGRSFRNVVVDSRMAGFDDLFIALPGARTDGHDFLQEARDKGCSYAIVSRSISVDIPHMIVSDPLFYLQQTVMDYISAHGPRVIAVTGSLGKTTTKSFLHQLLASTYDVAVSPGNSNSQIGLPVAILNHFSGKEDFWIVETGMSFPGELSRLCAMVQPEIALITQVAPVHVANFGQVEDIARAKAEVFSHSKTICGFINRHSSCLTILQNAGNCKKILVDDTEVQKKYPEALSGKHLYQNLAMAMEVARYLNVPQEKMDQLIPQLCLEPNRMMRMEIAGIRILNDSYNASELSTVSALNSIPDDVTGTKIAVIGQLAELGVFSVQTHQNIAQHALKCVDKMICYGKDCAPIAEIWNQAGKPVFWTQDRDVLIQHLNDTLVSGDFLLLKGSRPLALWELIPHLKIGRTV